MTIRRASTPAAGRTGKKTPVPGGEAIPRKKKDTRKLVEETIAMVVALQKGEEPTVNDTESYDNGVKAVPANLLAPVIVTKANAAEAYSNDPVLGPLTK